MTVAFLVRSVPNRDRHPRRPVEPRGIGIGEEATKDDPPMIVLPPALNFRLVLYGEPAFKSATEIPRRDAKQRLRENPPVSGSGRFPHIPGRFPLPDADRLIFTSHGDDASACRENTAALAIFPRPLTAKNQENKNHGFPAIFLWKEILKRKGSFKKQIPASPERIRRFPPVPF